MIALCVSPRRSMGDSRIRPGLPCRISTKPMIGAPLLRRGEYKMARYQVSYNDTKSALALFVTQDDGQHSSLFFTMEDAARVALGIFDALKACGYDPEKVENLKAGLD